MEAKPSMLLPAEDVEATDAAERELLVNQEISSNRNLRLAIALLATATIGLASVMALRDPRPSTQQVDSSPAIMVKAAGACPGGYKQLGNTGDGVPGWGLGYPKASTIGDCKAHCDDRKDCGSFEFNPTNRYKCVMNEWHFANISKMKTNNWPGSWTCAKDLSTVDAGKCGYTIEECAAAATKMGLLLGDPRWKFASNHWDKGCFYHACGPSAGVAYYGTMDWKGKEVSGMDDINKYANKWNSKKRRIPGTYDCGGPPMCSTSADCPEHKPICEPITGQCKGLTCSGATTDGLWGDGQPWSGVPKSQGKYTINYFKYMKGAGCLCMFNDWISSNNEICPDNYNYFQFKLKGGGGCTASGETVGYTEEQWEIYLYGDETMKVMQDGSEVMARAKPDGTMGAAGFGSSPNMEKPHTTYELCFPAAANMEVSAELSDPTQGGSYNGKCVAGGIKPEVPATDITIDSGGGGIKTKPFQPDTCDSDSDCTTDEKPVCVNGFCNKQVSGIMVEFTITIKVSMEIGVLIKIESFQLAIKQSIAMMLKLEVTMIKVQLFAVGAKLRVVLGINCGCAQKAAEAMQVQLKSTQFFKEFSSQVKLSYSKVTFQKRTVTVNIFSTTTLMYSKFDALISSASQLRSQALIPAAGGGSSSGSTDAALSIRSVFTLAGSVKTSVVKSKTLKVTMISIMTKLLKLQTGMVQVHLESSAKDLVAMFGISCGCTAAAAAKIQTQITTHEIIMSFAQSLNKAYKKIAITGIQVEIKVFASVTLMIQKFSFFTEIGTTKEVKGCAAKRSSLMALSKESLVELVLKEKGGACAPVKKECRRRKSAAPRRRRKAAAFTPGGRLLGDEDQEGEDDLEVAENNGEDVEAEERLLGEEEDCEEETTTKTSARRRRRRKAAFTPGGRLLGDEEDQEGEDDLEVAENTGEDDEDAEEGLNQLEENAGEV